jgi:hypothetical protein
MELKLIKGLVVMCVLVCTVRAIDQEMLTPSSPMGVIKSSINYPMSSAEFSGQLSGQSNGFSVFGYWLSDVKYQMYCKESDKKTEYFYLLDYMNEKFEELIDKSKFFKNQEEIESKLARISSILKEGAINWEELQRRQRAIAKDVWTQLLQKTGKYETTEALEKRVDELNSKQGGPTLSPDALFATRRSVHKAMIILANVVMEREFSVTDNNILCVRGSSEFDIREVILSSRDYCTGTRVYLESECWTKLEFGRWLSAAMDYLEKTCPKRNHGQTRNIDPHTIEWSNWFELDSAKKASRIEYSYPLPVVYGLIRQMVCKNQQLFPTKEAAEDALYLALCEMVRLDHKIVKRLELFCTDVGIAYGMRVLADVLYGTSSERKKIGIEHVFKLG